MAGQPGSSGPMSSQGQDAFGASLVSQLWPSSGYAGAAQSPYIQQVAPLFQSYQPALGSMTDMPVMQPAQINAPPPSPGAQGGKGSTMRALGQIQTLADPILSYSK